MQKITREDLLDQKIGDLKLSEWGSRWKSLPKALTIKHPDLRRKVGLLRFILNGEVKYIVRATEVEGGIEKCLARLRGPNQTGNSSYGAQMIRQHIDEVAVDVLVVGEGWSAGEDTKTLKKAMNKLYDPEWGWTAKKRMEKIRLGELPARC